MHWQPKVGHLKRLSLMKASSSASPMALAAASTAASRFCCLVRALVVVGKGTKAGRQPSIQRPYLALAAVMSSHSTWQRHHNTLASKAQCTLQQVVCERHIQAGVISPAQGIAAKDSNGSWLKAVHW